MYFWVIVMKIKGSYAMIRRLVSLVSPMMSYLLNMFPFILFKLIPIP